MSSNRDPLEGQSKPPVELVVGDFPWKWVRYNGGRAGHEPVRRPEAADFRCQGSLKACGNLHF